MQFRMNRVHSLVVSVESKVSKQPQRLILLKVIECPCVIVAPPTYISACLSMKITKKMLFKASLLVKKINI